MARILINPDKIAYNFSMAAKVCEICGVDLVVVTKCCAADLKILRKLVECGASSLADSHPQILLDFGKNIKKSALLAACSNLGAIVAFDYIFTSEIELLRRIGGMSLSHPPEIIVPVEVGDFREGVSMEALWTFVSDALEIDNIRIAGFSANLGCMKWTAPDPKTVDRFVHAVQGITRRFQFSPAIISVGGSTLWSLLKKNVLSTSVNQVRLGETIFLGYDPGLKVFDRDLHPDAFILEGEIVEYKEKDIPSAGIGQTIGMSPKKRHRIVLDFGYTTTSCHELIPMIAGIEIIGSSQDFTVIDVTNAACDFHIGESVPFLMKYKALAQAMTSPFPEKVYTD